MGGPLLAGSVPEAAEDTFEIDFPTLVSDDDEVSAADNNVSEKDANEARSAKLDLFRLNYMLNLDAAAWFDKG